MEKIREITYVESVVEALDEILTENPNAVLIGSTFFGLGPRGVVHMPMSRIQAKFRKRIYDPPISETGICGIAIGSAMAGLRPIVDLGAASFMFNGWPQIVNEAANAHYMSGGKTDVPAIFHVLQGIRGGGGSQHSHSPQAMLWNSPGLEIMLPSSPYDVKGLLKAASRRKNPVIFIDHVKLFGLKGYVPESESSGYSVPFGRADIKREGSDATVVATSHMVQLSLDAARELAKTGIEVEVVDPRTIVPLDKETILRSVSKTGRLVVVDECHRSAGVGSELSAIVAEEGFGSLRERIARVSTEDVPIPFSTPLEEYIEPTAEKIVNAVRSVVKK